MLENIAKNGDNRIVYDRDINLLFPCWRGKDEKVVIVGPHDDDPLIGGGLLLYELRNMGTDIYVAIITDGRKGYCKADQKSQIVPIRKKETENAYAFVGIDSEHIKRFDFPDSDLCKYAFQWETEEGKDDGLIAVLLKHFRDVGATRFLLPNENDFHLDHQATFRAALYAAIQGSEQIFLDIGRPCRRDTILKYGVWSPFNGGPTHSIKTSQEALDRKLAAIFAYESQKSIITEIIRELEARGPFEYFQEHVVKMFPAKEYTRVFFGR